MIPAPDRKMRHLRKGYLLFSNVVAYNQGGAARKALILRGP